MRLYNSLTRALEEFEPADPLRVTMYVCGPTVYDTPHLGNLRPAIVFDVLYRALLRLFPRVEYARNITDIDDKIMAAAKANREPIASLTYRTERDYLEVCHQLHILPPRFEPHATESIDAMIWMIRRLIDQGHAYVAADHVLFEIASFPDHGLLSRHAQEDLVGHHRIEVASYKRAPGDFVLWKPSDPEQPGWPSPWGRGRPGWHIECSAMIHSHFGPTIDLHGGGNDLKFPHHDCEITQSMAMTGLPLARYWVHNGMVTLDGRKMAKSEGNFVTVRELLSRYPGEAIRLAVLQTHYRSPLNWTTEVAESARRTMSSWYRALKRFDPAVVLARPTEHVRPILDAIEDDLNTPVAINHLHRLIGQLGETSGEERDELIAAIKYGAERLGLLMLPPSLYLEGAGLDDEIQALFDRMIEARDRRDYITSDRLRAELRGLGIKVENTEHGTVWRRE
jgi:cysteinyl-tRNA synthetase